MEQQILLLVNKLFENEIYSKHTEQAKQQIAEALKNKYEEFQKQYNEIEAMGFVMSEFGTLEKAGQLAGISKEEIASWKKTEDVMDGAKFHKVFKKQRGVAYGLALFVTMSLEASMLVFLYGKWFHYLFAFLCIVISTGFFVSFYRMQKEIGFTKNAYDQQARNEVNRMFDRYAKRLLNSVCYLIAGFFVEVFLFFMSMLHLNMNPVEAFISLFSSSVPFAFLTYILLKNILCKFLIDQHYEKRVVFRYQKYFEYATIVSAGYWCCFTVFTLLLSNVLERPVELMIFAGIVYFIFVISTNLHFRKQVVFSNVTVNIKRILLIGMVVLSMVSYQVMKMNNFILLPYISMIQEIQREPDEISYNDKNGVYTITTEKENFKILQLTDIHLGGSAASVGKDYLALKACKDLIEETHPDLVIVTGDLSFPLGMMSFSFNNTTPIIEFSNFMRNIGVPWAFTYGNHDTERVASGSVEEVEQTFKSLSFRSSGNLLYPYTQPDIMGRNNQMIEIRSADGTLKQALFLMDSNDYVDGINDYDYIHDDQVEWYRTQVEYLQEKEGKDVSSMLFFHMPLQQYQTANALYEAGSKEVTYYFGENKEKVEGKVCCSKYPSKLFDTAKELGSTKAMFCGHDHYNNLSVEYQGIRLTYGMSIDYLAMPGIDQAKEQRGATLITLGEHTEYDITQVPYNK